MSLEIRPLDAALGAEVSGLNPSQPLNSRDIDAIRDSFLEQHLLCFRSAPLPAQDFSALARNFGDPQLQLQRKSRHDDVPEVSVLDSTYKRPEDKPADLNLDRKSGWHTDDSYFEVPATTTLLQSIEIPDSGGHTRFCNTRKAYEDLSDAEKQRVAGLRAVHAYDTMRAPARAAKRTQQEIDETPEVVHPLIRTNEDTGAKAFFSQPQPHKPDRRYGACGKRCTARLGPRNHYAGPIPLRSRMAPGRYSDLGQPLSGPFGQYGFPRRPDPFTSAHPSQGTASTIGGR